MKLTIELVPKTCWFSNARDHLTDKQWNDVKKLTFEVAGHKCEICGGVGKKHPVECHEVWDYNDDTLTQKLVRTIALCPSCHEVKHIGFANVRKRGHIAKAHLAKVNDMTAGEAEWYVNDCFAIWYSRSQHDWKLDLSFLKRFGIEVEEKR